MTDIVTPCCGKPLLILQEYTGGYMGEYVPNEVVCTGEKCYNSWDAKGVEGAYNEYK